MDWLKAQMSDTDDASTDDASTDDASTDDASTDDASVFAPLVGQSQAIELLNRAVQRQRVAPAYLFTGPAGIGRSLAAACFAQVLLSQVRTGASSPKSPSVSFALLRQRVEQRNHPDLLWVEPTYLHQGKRLTVAEAVEQGLKRKAPPEIRLEQIRDVARFLSRPPLESARSVVVVEQAESMAEAAANGLLKTLEEPGAATLILLAPSPESLLPTLVSRCQRIAFHCLPPIAMAQVLTQVGQGEILQHPEVLALAQGSPGEAIVHWQQLQAIPAEILNAVSRLPQSLGEALHLARQISQALDPEAQIWLLDYLQQHLWHDRLQVGLVHSLGQVDQLNQASRLRQVDQFRQVDQLGRSNPQERSRVLSRLEQAKRQLLQYVQPRLVWEVMLMQLSEISVD